MRGNETTKYTKITKREKHPPVITTGGRLPPLHALSVGVAAESSPKGRAKVTHRVCIGRYAQGCIPYRA